MNRLSLSNDNGKYFANSELLKFLEHTKFSNLHDHKTLLIRLSVDGSKNVLEIIWKPSKLSIYKQINRLAPEVYFPW